LWDAGATEDGGRNTKLPPGLVADATTSAVGEGDLDERILSLLPLGKLAQVFTLLE
jgi:hypothetical protein